MTYQYTPSATALRMAKQYLKHEFRKIFHDIKDKKIWNKIDRSINNFNKRENDGAFWNLIAAISEDLKLKRVYHLLSSTKYEWKLKQIDLSELTLSSMSPTLNKYIIKQCKSDPLEFKKKWPKSIIMRQTFKKSGFAAHPERDHFPIFVYQTQNSIRIFDGMRRTLLALINNQTKIKAWIGYEVNPNGKSLISGGRCYFLQNLYENSPNFNKTMEQSTIRIGREIVKIYRNGKYTLDNRIGKWNKDPQMKNIINKITK